MTYAESRIKAAFKTHIISAIQITVAALNLPNVRLKKAPMACLFFQIEKTEGVFMVQPPRPSKVDVALLYQDYEPFSYANLARRLQTIVGDGYTVGLGSHQDGSFGILHIGGIVFKISQNDGPLSPDGFAGALGSPFTKMNCPDAQALVLAHRKNIFITVGNDNILTEGLMDSAIVAGLGSVLGDDILSPKTPNKSEFSNWLFMAQIVSSHISKMIKPDLIHWCQSDQLLTPDQFDLVNDPRAMNVQIHPSLFSSGNDSAGNQKIGFHAFGSEHITGHHVIVEETPLLFADVRSTVNDLIYSFSRSGDLPQDGHVVKMKSGAALRVFRKEPDHNFPRTYLSVEVIAVGTESPKAGGSSQKPEKPLAKLRPKTGTQFFQSNLGQTVLGIGSVLAFGPIYGIIIFSAWFFWSKFKPQTQ